MKFLLSIAVALLSTGALANVELSSLGVKTSEWCNTLMTCESKSSGLELAWSGARYGVLAPGVTSRREIAVADLGTYRRSIASSPALPATTETARTMRVRFGTNYEARLGWINPTFSYGISIARGTIDTSLLGRGSLLKESETQVRGYAAIGASFPIGPVELLVRQRYSNHKFGSLKIGATTEVGLNASF